MMKARTAKKILKQQIENDLPLHKVCKTWLHRWDNYCAATMTTKAKGRRDHRIEKAVCFAERWEKKKFKQTK